MSDPITKDRSKADDLVERYLAAVARRLPPKQAADITAELREAILASLEAKEAALGRPADKAEAAAVIKSFGSPMLAASRYSGHAYLLGPAIYPYFWPTQRIVIGVVAVIALIGGVIRGVVADNPWRIIAHAFSWAWEGAWIGFAITTVVFIVLERTGATAKFEARWNPRLLPRDSSVKPKTLFESLFSLVWDVIFIAWWAGVVDVSSITGPAQLSEVSLRPSDAWAGVHDGILALAILSAATHLADVFHPAWSRTRSLASIVGYAGVLVVCWMLARGGPLVVVEGTAARVAELQRHFDLISRVSLAGLALGVAIGIAVDAWRLARSLRLPAASLTA